MTTPDSKTPLVTTQLSELFARDLAKLASEVEAFADDQQPWQTLPGMTNSAGNLVLHLEGNLRSFIGQQMGNIEYVRDRDHEFAGKGYSKADLLARVQALVRSIPAVVAGVAPDSLATVIEPMPGRVLTRQQFLLHLYAHLSYHLGQINTLRRVLTGAGARP